MCVPALVAQDAGVAGDRVDLLSWGAGAFAVRLEDPASDDVIRAAIDGDPGTVTIGIPRRQPRPARFVVELAALTRFDTFAVPVLNELGPVRGRRLRTIDIEGSVEGPESGFELLGGQMATMSGRIVDRLAQVTYAALGGPAPAPVRATDEGDLVGTRLPRSFTAFWGSADADATPIYDAPVADADGTEEHDLDLSNRCTRSPIVVELPIRSAAAHGARLSAIPVPAR